MLARPIGRLRTSFVLAQNRNDLLFRRNLIRFIVRPLMEAETLTPRGGKTQWQVKRCPLFVRLAANRRHILRRSRCSDGPSCDMRTLFTLAARRAVGRRQSGSRSPPDPYAPEQIQRR